MDSCTACGALPCDWVRNPHTDAESEGVLMEAWQDAWARGDVQKGYFTATRGVAGWIGREVNKMLGQHQSPPPSDKD